MPFLLDTNACVDYLNGRYPAVTRRIQQTAPADLYTSSVVVAELLYGAEKSHHSSKNRQRVLLLAEEVSILELDLEAASAFGRIRAALERRGKLIGPYDMLIAAHAIAQGLVLVTDNVGEFQRVDGLSIENWREP